MGKLALAALPLARLLAARPNSIWGGVQVGINAPYSYGNNSLSAEETLNDTLALGLSAVELRTQPIESFLGAPPAPAGGDALKKWRVSQTADSFGAFRRKYEDAGVLIQIVKVDWIQNASDDEVDYCFLMARSVGAQAISCEIPLSKTKWLGAFADKHRMMVGYHGHVNTTDPEAFAKPSSWETAMSFSPYNGINLDLGHFLVANQASPVPFMEKYHARITHIHVKDRKFGGATTPFGEGDVPLRDVFRSMQKNAYKFQAAIEFEYPIPPGSTRMAEIGKCVEYCKGMLT